MHHLTYFNNSTVLAVWSSYPALYKHFSDAASDVNGKDKAEFKG